MYLACLQSATAAKSTAAKPATVQAGVAVHAHLCVQLFVNALTTDFVTRLQPSATSKSSSASKASTMLIDVMAAAQQQEHALHTLAVNSSSGFLVAG